MKTNHKFFLLVAVIGVAFWIKVAPAQTASFKKPSWEYWTAHGKAGVVMPGIESHLNQGFEIDRLETSGLPNGYSESYIVAILRREKVQ